MLMKGHAKFVFFVIFAEILFNNIFLYLAFRQCVALYIARSLCWPCVQISICVSVSTQTRQNAKLVFWKSGQPSIIPYSWTVVFLWHLFKILTETKDFMVPTESRLQQLHFRRYAGFDLLLSVTPTVESMRGGHVELSDAWWRVWPIEHVNSSYPPWRICRLYRFSSRWFNVCSWPRWGSWEG